MIPPVFTILYASTPVKTLLGSSPLRVFPWGEAPENVTKPYATYIVFSGEPENTLGEAPELDNLRTQIDIWAETVSSCVSVSEAVRDALEPSAHMTSFSSSSPDIETKLFHQRLDFDFFETR